MNSSPDPRPADEAAKLPPDQPPSPENQPSTPAPDDAKRQITAERLGQAPD